MIEEPKVTGAIDMNRIDAIMQLVQGDALRGRVLTITLTTQGNYRCSARPFESGEGEVEYSEDIDVGRALQHLLDRLIERGRHTLERNDQEMANRREQVEAFRQVVRGMR